MSKKTLLLALTLLGVFAFAFFAGAQPSGLSLPGNTASAEAASDDFQLANGVESGTPQTDADRLEATKAYVDEAIRRYREDPRGALAYYRSEESIVNDPPGLYLLLLDGDIIEVNPVFSTAEGTSISWRDDPLGNMYGARLAAADENGSVVEYLIPIPSQDYTYRKKTAWAIRADVPDIDNPGSEVSRVFSAGWLDLETEVESSFTETQKAVAEVIEARGRVQAETAVATLNYYRSPESIDGEFYVWLAYPTGRIAADATMPELEGENIAEAYPPEVAQEILGVREFETRWISHEWPNPVTGQEELKHTYVSRFFGFYIISGYYGETPPVVGPRAAAQAYVETAIAAYAEDPEAAKAYYQSEESVDRELDLYLIIIEGTTITLNGGFPGGVGADVTGRLGRDAINKEYGKEFVSADENGKWVDYLIPDPFSDYTLYRKHTWVIRVGDRIFAAGSWDKDEDVESTLRPHQRAVSTAFKVGARILAAGGAAGLPTVLPYLSSPAAINGEYYAFLIHPNGTILADPVRRDLIGTNVRDLRASDDPELGMKIAALEEGGELWISHMWLNPATRQEGVKHTYVSKFQGLTYGSGYYGDTPPPGMPMPPVPCTEIIGGDSPTGGEWASDCVSENLTEDGDHYARYFTFTLTEETDVTITLKSDEDTYLFLLDEDGEKVAENDDISDNDTNSRIVATLDAGDYTIEATTFKKETTGSFTLTVEAEVPPPPVKKYKTISSGAKHACAIATDGSIDCRGDDSFGQVSERPASGSFTHITSGDDHSCALRDDGEWICWGSIE